MDLFIKHSSSFGTYFGLLDFGATKLSDTDMVKIQLIIRDVLKMYSD